MSRKSAYALRARDSAFAAAWDAAYAAGAPDNRNAARPNLVEGDEVDEVHDPRFAPPQGDSATLPGGLGRLFAPHADRRGESAAPQLAPRVTLP
jgi:hypothetical protein